MAYAISPKMSLRLLAGAAACAALVPLASAQSVNDPITRVDFVTELTLNTYPPESFTDCYTKLSHLPYTLLFKDVSRDDSFGPSVCLGIMGGYINGYSDATFRPNETMNFAEVSQMIAKAYGFRTFPAQGTLPWYQPYITVLAQNGAIPVSIDSPSHLVTVAEAEDIMDRVANGITNRPSRSEKEVQTWWKK